MQIISGSSAPAAKQALIVYWLHPFKVVENPATAAAIGLAALGYRVTLANCQDSNDVEHCFRDHSTFDFVIHVGAIALDMRREGHTLFETATCRQYYWMLDPIFHDLNRVSIVSLYLDLAAVNPNLFFLSPDRGGLDMLSTRVGGRAWYFPFGGFFTPFRPEAYRKRRRRIAVFGTIGSELADVREASLDDLLKSLGIFAEGNEHRASFIEAIQNEHAPSDVSTVFREFLRIEDRDLLTPGVVGKISAVDSFEKRRRRLVAVANLMGAPVDFYGTGWEKIAGVPGFRAFGPVLHTDIASIIESYHVVMNFDPNWDDGVHDRVFTALGSGARVVTNRNRALPPEAISEGYLLTYSMNAPAFKSRLLAFLNESATDPAWVTTFRQNHSWTSRMDRFLSRHLGWEAGKRS